MITVTLKNGFVFVGKVKHLKHILSELPPEMKLLDYARFSLH